MIRSRSSLKVLASLTLAKKPKFLIPQTMGKKSSMKTLVLDLDETLVGMFVHPKLKSYNILDTYQQTHRKYLKDFLLYAKKNFEVVLWTAGTMEYAQEAIQRIEEAVGEKNLFDHVVARDPEWFRITSRTWYSKQLHMLGRPLRNVLMIENSPVVVPPENCLLVCDYYHPVKPKIPELNMPKGLGAHEDDTLYNAIALLKRWKDSPLPVPAFLMEEARKGDLLVGGAWPEIKNPDNLLPHVFLPPTKRTA
eukprot:PhF_6_TR38904/c0_g1_i2/m.58193/K15731/CTDSP; carboxy-terminal domain RNA polymerase II polypeptide A small phosphatase